MNAINNLVDLLLQTIENLNAAEGQVMRAMPSIIDKVQHSSVKNALTHHAGLTEEQKTRLQKAKELINQQFAGSVVLASTEAINKGMAGLIEEAQQLLAFEISKDVTDAAVISAVQKIEHYEICAYGTALAYARQLHLHKVERLLNETLDEEYDADDLLTSLATAAINKEGVPEDLQKKVEAETPAKSADNVDPYFDDEPTTTTRTITSPGGRAGSSHRRYGDGASRGH